MGDRKNERQRLLALVGDLILAEGVSTLSLSGVARSIGSNNRMLLYYFGSKEDLLAAIDGRYSQAAVRRIRAAGTAMRTRTFAGCSG